MRYRDILQFKTIKGVMEQAEERGASMIDQMQEKRIREAYRTLTRILVEKQLSITTMESATSGQVASLITDTEGASAILKGAFITYSNEAKIMQGVPKQLIEQYGVYSEETAKAMAMCCRNAYDAKIGIGITGTMGNIDPANEDSVPGQVYFAIDFAGRIYSYNRKIQVQPSRYAYKLAVAKEIVDILLPLVRETT